MVIIITMRYPGAEPLTSGTLVTITLCVLSIVFCHTTIVLCVTVRLLLGPRETDQVGGCLILWLPATSNVDQVFPYSRVIWAREKIMS